MANVFVITLILIAVVTIVGAFTKGRSKDGCLVDFNDYPVTMESNSGKDIWGRLNVEATGMEFTYKEDYLDEKDGHIEKSYIIYKSEYPTIEMIVRYHDQLSDEEKHTREKELKKYYHPKSIYRLGRKLRNVFFMVRDAIMEVFTVMIGHVRSTTRAGAVLSGQDKYISQIQQQLSPLVNYSFEPLLEKYIGKKVVLKMKRGDVFVEYLGILKDYTPDFVEILDVMYKKGDSCRTADMILSRQGAFVRHLGN